MPFSASTVDVYKRQEVYHGVKIQDGALIAAATLSNRYITDRFLPDKAIDLVDEDVYKRQACSRMSWLCWCLIGTA